MADQDSRAGPRDPDFARRLSMLGRSADRVDYDAVFVEQRNQDAIPRAVDSDVGRGIQALDTLVPFAAR